MRILLVDDKAENLYALKKLLQNEKYEIDTALSGIEALKKALIYDYNLFILDVQMPVMDGYELASLFKGSKKTKNVPIIFLTALNNDTENIKRGLELGAIDYLSKPVNSDLLRLKVYNLSQHFQRQIELEKTKKQLKSLNKDLEKKVEKKNAALSSLLTSLDDIVFVIDENYTYLDVFTNRDELLFLPKEQLIGKTFSELFEEELFLLMKKLIDNSIMNETGIIEFKSESPVGEKWFEARGNIIKSYPGIIKKVSVFVRDITERKSFETFMLRNQRLESLGTLASGIAHDLNNVLTPVLMGIELLKMTITDKRIMKNISVMETSVKRGANIIKQVLNFGRGVESEKNIVDLKNLIKENEGIIKETFPKNISLDICFESGTFEVLGDATQLHQVLMNLSINARDAMPGGGVLSIYLSSSRIDEINEMLLPPHISENISSEYYICLCVSDTGIGMPPHIADRVFEPFFTTKELGKGTGLGLSTVFSIIKNHNGFIDLSSEVDNRTTFKIYIPEISPDNINTVLESKNTGIPTGKGELVLIVDDEVSVLKMTSQVLENYNYKVLFAENGLEAVKLFPDNPSIELVIIDLDMPVMDGRETFKYMKGLNDKLKIIFVSGIPQIDIDEYDKSKVFFLQKPYSSARLLSIINDMLSSV